MREDHQAVERAVAARREQAAAQDDRPGVAHHPPLAAPLALDRRHHLLRRPRVGHVDRAAAALDHQEREREVVAHDRVDLDVVVAADRVDRAVPARDRGERRLLGAQPHLVAPVDALLVGAGVGHEADLAAGVAHRRDRRRRRRAGPARPAPSSRWRRRRRAGRRARRGPPRPARAPCRRAAARAPGRRRRRGRARRSRRRRRRPAVDRDDQLEPVARPVERERVGDLGRDHVLLAVGGDDQRHLRLLSRRPRPSPGLRPPSAAEAPGTARRAPVSTPAARRTARTRRRRGETRREMLAGGRLPGVLRHPDPPLSDGVITLRPMTAKDADALTAACQDPEIARWTRVPVPYRRADALSWIAASELELDAGVTIGWLAVDADDRVLASISADADRPPGCDAARSATGWPARRAGAASRPARCGSCATGRRAGSASRRSRSRSTRTTSPHRPWRGRPASREAGERHAAPREGLPDGRYVIFHWRGSATLEAVVQPAGEAGHDARVDDVGDLGLAVDDRGARRRRRGRARRGRARRRRAGPASRA